MPARRLVVWLLSWSSSCDDRRSHEDRARVHRRPDLTSRQL